MLRYVLFDLDGTLTDSAEGITKCVQYALQDQGINEPDLKKLHKFIGPPLRYSFETFYGFTPKQAEDAVKKYRERFSTVGMYENKLYDGILGLLNSLKQRGLRLGVATSKPEIFARPIIDYFKITACFEQITGSDLSGRLDKKALVIEEALRRMAIGEADKTAVIMVGDRREDIIAAHANGLTAIGVGYGFGSRSELLEAGADFYAPDLPSLSKLLQTL